MCRPPRSTERGDPADFSSCASIHLGLASWTRPSGGHNIRGLRVYEVEGVPPLRIEGQETAYFDGDRITRIEDRIPDDQGERAMAFLAEHAGKLKP